MAASFLLFSSTSPYLTSSPSLPHKDICTYSEVPASVIRAADQWFDSLLSKISATLDNATYGNYGCDGTKCAGTRPGQPLEASQPIHGFARFDFLQAVKGACGGTGDPHLLYHRGLHPPSKRGHRDGGKWLCALVAKSNATHPGVILSLGSKVGPQYIHTPLKFTTLTSTSLVLLFGCVWQNQFDFEQSVVMAYGPSAPAIHTYDCTLRTVRVPPKLQRHVTFHPTCAGQVDGVDGSGRRFVRWRTLVDELGNPPISLLKVDIEGHERQMLWQMLSSEHALRN